MLLPKLVTVAHTSDSHSLTQSPSPDTMGLTTVAQDYLKVIWTAQEWSHEKVSTKMLAERIGVSASTASEAIKKLADQGLVDHARYGSIALTERGRDLAVHMVRRHRLLETFLVNELGYGWDEVHDEAEILEHAVSESFLTRIDRKLGHPQRDPHGDPIPSVDGQVRTPPALPLSDFANGQSGKVARISDADPEMLRYFDSVGIALDTLITVIERRDFVGTISIRLDTTRETLIDLGNIAAQSVWLINDDATTEGSQA
ncbi:MAG: metal-dependent transcriptional regulator [Mycobacteriaceae bacterium]